MTVTLAVDAASDADLGHRTARWVASLFTASVLLQRISLPGGVVPVLLPLVYLWVLYGVHTGILEVDRRRLRLLLVAAGLTSAVALLQTRFVVGPLISLTSWGLFMAIWIPAAFRLVDRSRATVRTAFESCVRVGSYLAIATVVMMAVQVVGVRYVDYVASVVPKTLLVQGYVITYPLTYLSPIYRGNAWIGLEPSTVSFQIGVCLVLAILLRSRARTMLVLFAGLACTVSGSGILIVVVGVLVMLFYPIRRQLLAYTVTAGAAVIVVWLTPVGQQEASRVTEVTFSGSSTSLRAIQPYRFLWPQWSTDPMVVLLGRGAGASQKLMEQTGIAGLLVPSPIKVFFDYGVVAGAALAAYLLFCYVGGPSRALAIALLLSSWLLQPGTTTLVLALPTMLFVTWWAPRVGRPIEADPLRRTAALP